MKKKYKRIIFGIEFWVIVALSVGIFLAFTSCNENSNIKNGTYVAGTGIVSRIDFDTTKQSFVFMHTAYLSTLIGGTYECEDGKIFATSEENVYVFRIVDNDSISFIKGESSETPLEDGTIFRLTK